MADAEKESLESRVLKDIEKTGFPLELRVSNRFIEAGYYVQHSVYYVDRDEQKGREIEIIAHSVPKPRTSPPAFIRMVCVAECKKATQHPWVIFTSPKTTYDEAGPRRQSTGLTDTIKWTNEIVSSVTVYHQFWLMPRRGRSFHEAFRSSEDRRESSSIFKAVTTVVKATLSQIGDANVPDLGDVRLFQPIVVFEGTVLEAYLDGNEEVVLERPKWVPVSFAYQSAAYPDSRLTVVVVTEQALPELLKHLEDTLQAWHLLLTKQPALVQNRKK